MKTLLFTLVALVLSTSLQAEIRNSTLAKRHQDLVELAVDKQCSLTRGFIVEVSNKTTAIQIDNGITDYEFETVLEVNERIDQNMYDTYLVTVKSAYYDSYDHNSQDWGSYAITAISECVQQ